MPHRPHEQDESDERDHSVPAVDSGFVDPTLDDPDNQASDNPLPLITDMEGITVPDEPFDLGPAAEERMDGGGGGTLSDNPIESGVAGSDQEPPITPHRLAEEREPEDPV